MRPVIELVRNNKDFAVFVTLTYIDKFLIFLLPLAVLYITNDRDCYNEIEYIYSVAGVLSPFFVFFSTYAFFGYKKSLEEKDDLYIKAYRSYGAWLIIVLALIGVIISLIVPTILTSLSVLMAFMVLGRFLYLQTVSNNSTYFRLIDNPARFVVFTIICSIASAISVYIIGYDKQWVMFAFFLPQIILSLGDSIIIVLVSNINWKGFIDYLWKSLRYAWPIVINCTLVAFVMNYGKIYAYNFLSSYEMYNFSYILRISLVIQMAHSSLMAFYGKDLFVNGYSVLFYKKYTIVILVAFILSILCLYGFNLFITDKLTIDLTTYLILLYSLIISYAASLEVFFSRKDQNKVILFVSVVSCLVFLILLFFIGKGGLRSLALCMVIYSLIYLITLYMIAKAKLFLVCLIALLPINCLRIFFYNLFFDYDIDYSSHIGMFNILKCERIYMRKAVIGCFNRIQCVSLTMNEGSWIDRMNKISFLNELNMEANSKIGRQNSIIGYYMDDNENRDTCNFILGEKSLLTHQHRIDCTTSVHIGKNVVVAGNGTQMWTHGFDYNRNMIVKPIHICDNIYVGSRSIICQGVTIVSNVVIGAGTCVHKSISEAGFYVSNMLCKKSDVK